MNFVQKQIVGGLSAVVGIVLFLVGIFTAPGVLWTGVALFLGGIALVGYNMYSIFSGKGLTEAAVSTADMAEQISRAMDDRRRKKLGPPDPAEIQKRFHRRF